jgi:hypothetical protein
MDAPNAHWLRNPVMRAATLVMVWAIVATAQAEQVSVLEKLRDRNWQVRAQGVEQVAKDSELLHAAAVRRALIQLLDEENRSYRDPHPLRRSDPEQEAYGRYYDRLLTRVSSFVDPTDVASVSISSNRSTIRIRPWRSSWPRMGNRLWRRSLKSVAIQTLSVGQTRWRYWGKFFETNDREPVDIPSPLRPSEKSRLRSG